MKNTGSMAIIGTILLIAIILIGIIAFSVLSSDTNDNSEGDLTEQYSELIDETINEITTYIQINDKLGKYYGEPHHQKIEKIAIMIKPLVSANIDLSELTIKIANNDLVKILNFNKKTDLIGYQSLFEHLLWDKLDENNFSFIATHDSDKSTVEYNTINKNTDMGYIIIKLSEDFYMKKGDTLLITLFPGTGITRTIILEAPLPIKSVVTLD